MCSSLNSCTCDYDLIWKWFLADTNQVKVKSYWTNPWLVSGRRWKLELLERHIRRASCDGQTEVTVASYQPRNAKDCYNQWRPERGEETSSPRAFTDNNLAQISFQKCETIYFCCFKQTQFVVSCYGCPRLHTLGNSLVCHPVWVSGVFGKGVIALFDKVI